MLISLYTVRAVLKTLGAADYGIYNVVSGIVSMFAFLSGSLAYATQRFLSIELGRGDFYRLRLIFSASIFIYLIIALIVVILSETIGLWFINSRLTVQPDRTGAARLIYQTSIIAFVFTLLTTPCTALVLAHEDMGVYALLSIIKTTVELAAVIALPYSSADKLKLYGIFVCAAVCLYFLIYAVICKIKYPQCAPVFKIDRGLFKEMAVYNGWMLFASFAGIFKNQIINVLINQYFSPAAAASRALSMQVNTAVSGFFSNFNMSLRPPIVKSYAARETGRMIFLVFTGTKASFFLMYIFTLPLLLEAPFVFSLWLEEVPEHAVLFTRLALIEALVASISYPVDTAALAAKKVGLFEAVLGGLLLLNLPASWIVFTLGFPAYSCLVIAVIIVCLMFFIRLVIIPKMIDFPVVSFIRKVLLPLFVFTILSALPPVLIFRGVNEGWRSFLLVTGASVISVCASMYCIGLNNAERGVLRNIIMKKMQKVRSLP